MERTVSERAGDYKTADLAADAVAMRQSGDAADEGQKQNGGRGEQETVHKPSSPLEASKVLSTGNQGFPEPELPLVPGRSFTHSTVANGY